MLGIIFYAIGVMYTPGPVNILSLTNGMQRASYKHVPFSLGVATALCFWFLLIGYTGSALISEKELPIIAGVGVCFIFYLTYQILSSSGSAFDKDSAAVNLTYKEGLLMQLLNPKCMLVVLPIATVHFPAVGIEGGGIVVWSVLLGCLGFGAPFLYSVFGSLLSKSVIKTSYLTYVNYLMGAMLFFVAVDMAYQHIYLELI
ncbi:LysE family translocator [Halodesulfovibrio sp. MK-HDV]|jgi:threonine/homoserine/homoserine lactone efflux protein|uniref:LysE family translocator n=1 Tax=Halodesulfovibrio sp. MK-HDV TaxID=2599925 RepID=UPI00136BBD01|nr:LysE family transporter [Halodesulfovibrio sp. MK-HDV]KAF1074119.1 hypothetical protein MKHDV_03106 [Halodesulfovibrio sp. MK-HDV]